MSGSRKPRGRAWRAVFLWFITAQCGIVCRVLGNERAEEYEIWLAAMPMDPLTAPSMRGSGKLMARLQGSMLTISGDIKDLESPASGAELRRATPGMRGAVVFKV